MTEVRCVIYSRVSDMDVDPTSKTADADLEQKLRFQIEALTTEAKRRGWKIVAIYKERHTGTTDDRPELNRMKTELHALGATKVLIYSPDRMAREYRTSADILGDLEKLGVEVLFSVIPLEDADPMMRKFVFGMMGLVAGLERDMIVARLGRGAKMAKEEGTMFSTVPNHFKQDGHGIIRPDSVGLDIYERSLQGESSVQIAAVHSTYRRDVERTIERVRKWKTLPAGVVWKRGKKVLRALRENNN